MTMIWRKKALLIITKRNMVGVKNLVKDFDNFFETKLSWMILRLRDIKLKIRLLTFLMGFLMFGCFK